MADHDAGATRGAAFVALESALIRERSEILSIARCREKSHHLRSEGAHYLARFVICMFPILFYFLSF